MAKKDMEEITRFIMTNSQLKDANGQIDPSHLKDLKKQVNEMVRAIESATGSIVRAVTKIDTFGNAVTSFDVKKSMAGVAEPVFDRVLGSIEARYGYQAGSLALDPYNSIQKTTDYRELVFHKDFHGAIAKRSAKEAMERAGGSYQPDPSKEHQDRAKLSFNVSETDWQNELAKTGGDVTKAKSNFARRLSNMYLKDAMRYSKDTVDKQKDKDDEREQRREEKEEKSNRRKVFHTLTLIIGALTAIADITRRILTATLARASEIKKESVDAKSLGITYASMREYKAQETAMGMKEGTFASAIGALQSATGDISNLDTNVIKELAKVMQGDVIEAINNGLGRSDPEKLMGMILDTYYKRGQSGINSLGQQVGKYQAERELATALEKAGLGDIAEILRNMFYTNDTGIYKGRVGRETPFEDYMKLATAYTMGLTPTDYKKASELGAVVDSLKKTFNDLKENLETKLLNSLGGLIDKINSWQIGMSAEERVTTNEEKTRLNKQQIEHMQKLTEQTKPQVEKAFKDAGIDFTALGVKGVTSAETYVKWRQDWRARNWEPKTDKAKETAQMIDQFLLTEQGKEATRLIALSETAQELEQQAQKDLRQSAQTGTVVYQATSYTDNGISSKARDKIMRLRGITLPLGKDKVGVGVYTPEAVLGAVSALLGGFNYGKALESQSSKRLTEDLADKAEQRWVGRVPFSERSKVEASWKAKTKGLSKEELVKWALATGILTEKDVRDIAMKALELGYTPDYGITPEVFDKAREAVRQKEEKETLDTASRQLIVNEALKQSAGTVEAQELFRQQQAESKVYAQVVSYDDKKGQATVRVELDITGNGQKVGHFDKTIQTDAQNNGTAVFQQRMDMTGSPALGDMTRESMTNSSTR
jgi:hypothetical protein